MVIAAHTRTRDVLGDAERKLTRVWIDGAIYGAQRVGGISRYFTEILEWLPRHAPELEILLQLPPGAGGTLPIGTHIRRITSPGMRPARVFLGLENRLARQRILARKPSLYHPTYYASPRDSHLPTVVTVYDFLHERFASMLGDREFSRKKRDIIEKAHRVVVISEATRDDVLRFTDCRPDRISIAYPAISDVFSQPTVDGARDRRAALGVTRPYLLFVGRRGQYKNFSLLLHALSIGGARLDFDVVAVGGAPALESWESDFVTRNRLEDRIHLVGELPDESLRDLYVGARGVVVPSLGEGFGIPLVEGMAAGTPIVVSDIPVFREIAGSAALYFDPHDPAALAEQLTALGDERRMASARAAGATRAAAFTWDAAARVYADVYREVSDG